MLTKSLKKGRLTAESLLSKLSQVGGIPEPHYEYEACGSVKKPLHFFKVRFRVPHFINGDRKGNVFYDTIHGAGRCTTKQFAKSLAALEAVHRLEEELDVQRGSLQNRLDDYLAKLKRKQEELEAFPVNQQLPGVSWENIPIDASFSETLPAGRLGRLEFFPQLVDNVDAFTAAKAITLTSEERLPTVDIHVNHSKTKELQRWANIRAAGIIKGVVGVNQVSFINLDNKEAMMRALELLCYKIRKEKNLFIQLIIAACDRGKDSSFGMAKLFVSLPKHQFSDLKLLLGQVQDYEVAIHPQVIYKRHRGTSRRSTFDDGESLKARIISLRAHQTRHPLPIDSVEATIPDHVDVTIVRGGTGSGKVHTTQNYCAVMLAFEWPNVTLFLLSL